VINEELVNRKETKKTEGTIWKKKFEKKDYETHIVCIKMTEKLGQAEVLTDKEIM
jgi:hypothetical protein